jgi:hypothetical protein
MEAKSNPNLSAACTCIGRVLDCLAHQRLSERNLVIVELILLG